MYQAALDADERFSQELVRVYGSNAHMARYWPDHEYSDPGLLEAKRAKVAADEAWFNYTRLSREVCST